MVHTSKIWRNVYSFDYHNLMRHENMKWKKKKKKIRRRNDEMNVISSSSITRKENWWHIAWKSTLYRVYKRAIFYMFYEMFFVVAALQFAQAQNWKFRNTSTILQQQQHPHNMLCGNSFQYPSRKNWVLARDAREMRTWNCVTVITVMT